uniref:Uncharacterized protein n=1 Tax=Pseudo-nitzschia delicatissima TaxID=44447 RepID=A0A7S0UIA0_9STRA|mmetsp:Transcript_966/g.1957  ORF Transcript_966/g.1957 Transcript_966/m.1957 type:complete len:236 (+) Transcript_966:91-798(+)
MSKALLLAILCVAFPSVSGTATLHPRLSSAGCTGHLSDLSVTSITCDYSTDGCTFGSKVFVTGQVTADNDIPRPMKVSVWTTLPSVYSVGTPVSTSYVDDVCDTGVLTTYPDGSEDTCPGAGLYNFQFVYDSSGSNDSWYAGWSGYTFGVAMHIKHEGGGSDFSTCHINVHAAGDGYATNATFVSIAALGVAGLFAGMFAKKRRKERLSSDAETEERRKEMATNFELVQDSNTIV